FMLGQVALSQGNDARAQTFYETGLALFREMRAQSTFVGHILAGLGALAQVRGRPEQAAHLLGVAALSLRSFAGIELPLGKRADLEGAVAATQTQLGE